MSLSRRLGFGFFAILICILLSLFWLHLKNAKSFIEQQLVAQTQDTATSIHFAIAAHIDTEEGFVTIESLFQALIDGGNYSKIVLFNDQGTALVSVKDDPRRIDAPRWFIRLVDLRAPEVEIDIDLDGNNKGHLAISGFVGTEYEKFYRLAIYTLFIFVIAFAVSVAFIWRFSKKWVIAPLDTMLNQVKSIGDQGFEIAENTPSTPEFKKVTDAMNAMSNRLAAMFSELTKQSELYRSFAYIDDLTQLGNRRAFELALNKLLTDENAKSYGFLLIVRANSLGNMNLDFGAPAGDAYLSDVKDAMLSFDKVAETDSSAFFRISGADFAILIEGIDRNGAVEYIEHIVCETKRLEKDEHIHGTASIGGTAFSAGDELPIVLAQADSALTQASENPAHWMLVSDETVSLSNDAWKDMLNMLIEQGTAEFAVQLIQDSKTQSAVYEEWFARLPDKSGSFNTPMNQLIPASIKFDCAVEIDKLIITNLVKLAQPGGRAIGFNVSRISIFDDDFRSWLLNILQQNNSIASMLVIEIPERALLHDIKYLKAFCRELRAFGVKICIEHFGAQLAGIAHLRAIMPDYVKLDGRYTRDIDTQEDNQLFIQTLIGIADSLSICIIAEMVETEAEYDWFRNVGVHSMQGYFIQTPV
ncbi:MAG: EAL domain-containing protein [Pseudomonadota bacterium]